MKNERSPSVKVFKVPQVLIGSNPAHPHGHVTVCGKVEGLTNCKSKAVKALIQSSALTDKDNHIYHRKQHILARHI